MMFDASLLTRAEWHVGPAWQSAGHARGFRRKPVSTLRETAYHRLLERWNDDATGVFVTTSA
jgi:hypothetical protein